ncbi:MAG: xanthine dehydrogenase family protein molybdopterin-binding subunit, partial [Treponema sp.]|nr:xanthine dehydrogenase family protein molybdopterin-binding subunit [Treponema sp.]
MPLNKEARFVGDISVPGMIHAATIRSPVARGVLLEVECPDLPDSYCLITAAHIPGKNELFSLSVPILAGKILSYIGQPVAILVGQDESMVRDLASQINVIAEEKEAANNAGDDVFAEVFQELLVKRDIRRGDPDVFFEKDGTVVEGSYATGIQAHWYPDPHGALAVPAAAESPALPSLAIHTATQWPHHVRRSVESMLGWDKQRITVSPARAAMHLDGKLWYPSLVACHAAIAAAITAKPVKLMLSGQEDFLYAPKRNGASIKIRSALGEKGDILASALRLTLNLGSHGIFSDEIIDHTCLGSLGLYHHPAFRIDAAGLRANIPPQGPLSGFGLAQGFFAAERHASRIADSLGQDPAEWRKNNALKAQKTQMSFAIGARLKHNMPLPDLIDSASLMSDYSRKWASYELLKNSRRGKSRDFTGEPLRGIGIATACQGNGFLHSEESGNANCAAEARLEKDGSLEIKASLPEWGAAADILRNMAQEILGVEGNLVRFANAAAHDAPD